MPRVDRGDTDRARAAIERAFPDLAVREIAFLGAGMDSDAFLVNDALVFRFPKREDVARALEWELALLPKLAPRLPVAAPRFTHVARPADGLLFAGYPVIRGAALTAERFASLVPADQERVLGTLAAFLQAVHAFPVEEARAIGVKEPPSRKSAITSMPPEEIRVFPLLAPEEGAALARLIESFLADERNLTYPPTLLYNDFATEHIRFDTATNRISGIIDWGDLEIGDPDYDLMYLRQDYGEDFVRRLLAYYPHPEPDRLLHKLRVWDACDLFESVAYPPDEPHNWGTDDEMLAAVRAILRLTILR